MTHISAPLFLLIMFVLVALAGCGFGPCVTEFHPFSHSCAEPRD